MKKKVIAISLLTIAALFGTTVSASADAASDYKTQLQAWKDATAAQQAAYKASLTTYAAAKKVEAAAKKAIADKFKTDSAASKAKTNAAVSAATTAEAKKAARAAGKAEMDAIVAARNASLAAVVSAGAAPVKPTPLAKPVAPVKTPKPTKSAITFPFTSLTTVPFGTPKIKSLPSAPLLKSPAPCFAQFHDMRHMVLTMPGIHT